MEDTAAPGTTANERTSTASPAAAPPRAEASLGRVVHYVLDAASPNVGAHRTAFITSAFGGPVVNLHILLDQAQDLPDANEQFHSATRAWSVPFNEVDKKPGTWHWPERIEKSPTGAAPTGLSKQDWESMEEYVTHQMQNAEKRLGQQIGAIAPGIEQLIATGLNALVPQLVDKVVETVRQARVDPVTFELVFPPAASVVQSSGGQSAEQQNHANVGAGGGDEEPMRDGPEETTEQAATTPPQ